MNNPFGGWFDSVARWWRSDAPPAASTSPADQASDALRQLLDDPTVPESVRRELGNEFARIQSLLDKLARSELHVAVFGRVSVGKSALGNALLGLDAFGTGVLHGTTTRAEQQRWTEAGGSGLHLIDTPGINELDGEARERLAFEVAEISDLVLFVVDGDMTQVERDALATLAATERPLLLVLNKADRYDDSERERLLVRLREHTAGIVPPANVLACAASPAPQRVVEVDAQGRERERREARPPEVDDLRERLLAICAREGKTLSALNAGLFAGRLSDQVAQRIAEVRRGVADTVIRYYCLAKGVAVALNPVPVADLLAAAALDAALVMHLGKVYGLPLTRREAGQLILTICAQLAALMGAIWGVHLVASALKVASAGVSTLLTAGAQGALAWYATQVVGRAAERYLVAGKSWGDSGPKRVVQDIVAQLDRDSILREAREEILARLRGGAAR
ncbi:MAG TPA: GTP-binding protein [Tahibacter sp.]|uniref:GTP-binding protein n=1 Tax=Tahibacter sp. TaxID=2056211 RepID=UPI002CDB691D|nr:GTP-binding protein [Tahibacter sp.]HSX61315.1 GTP-binding protein [Tahibacter sp.]